MSETLSAVSGVVIWSQATRGSTTKRSLKPSSSHAIEGQKAARAGQFQATPLAIHDTLFFSTALNRVIALDATTGREL